MFEVVVSNGSVATPSGVEMYYTASRTLVSINRFDQNNHCSWTKVIGMPAKQTTRAIRNQENDCIMKIISLWVVVVLKRTSAVVGKSAVSDG